MKVLHFYKTSLPQSVGGVEVFLDTLCNSTANLGVENTILSLATKPEKNPIQFRNYKIVHAKQNLFIASTGISISAFRIFKQLASNADIIHYHFPNPFADILHFTCKPNKPTLVTYHSDIIKQKFLVKLYKPLMQRFLASVDRIIATSPNYFATSDTLATFKDKVNIIPIGIDKQIYPQVNSERIDYWQQRLPKPFFLFIGAMRYYKGLHIALDAIKGTNHQLVLAGKNYIETKIKENQLSNLHLLGPISNEDKVALLNLCHAFVFPSHLRSEAFGVALLEAAAYGKPMISCEIGTGTSYVNIHDQTGLVIEPASADKLRQAMQHLLENTSEAAKFGTNAKKRYQELFTAEKQAQAYVEVYEDLLKR
ncbi:MAG: glycosyltransferase [Pseudomonadota bacterium]